MEKVKEDNISSIISQINEKGVKEAESKKAEILGKAEQQAKQILQNAKDEASKILENAKKDAEALINNAEHQVKKGLKNASELLKQRTTAFLTELLNTIVRRQLSQQDFLADLIKTAVKKWVDGEKIEIELKDASEILGIIDKEILEGKTLTMNDSLHGFTIKREGDSITWQFTDESIVEILTPLLSGQLNKLFNDATAEK